jgi:hypothetical protein
LPACAARDVYILLGYAMLSGGEASLFQQREMIRCGLA